MRVNGVLAMAALGWVALLAVAPFWLEQPAHSWQRELAALTYVAGSGLCHQLPRRSFALAGHPMPVCGRCAGLYAGGAAGLLAAALLRPRRLLAGRPARLLFAAAAVPTLLTFLAEWVLRWPVTNGLRAAAAVPVAAAAGWMLGSVSWPEAVATGKSAAVR
jgi:uncharacterized membrane protein